MPTLPINWILKNHISGGGIRYGPELHTDANAASDPNGNEADATTGWTPTGLTGTGANVFESQSVVKNTGSYALHTDANDTPTASCRIDKAFTVEDGMTYRITFSWRHIGTGGSWDFQSEGVTRASVNLTHTSFIDVEYDQLMVGTALNIRIRESNTNDGGVYVDNFSVRKIL